MPDEVREAVPYDDITVRPMRPADVAAVARAHLAAWQAAFRGILSDALLDGLRIEDFESAWRQLVHAQNRSNLVAQRDGVVLGYASLGPALDPGATTAGEVYGIYVHPEHWRLGTGSALLAHAVSALEREGHTTIVVWTMAENRVAHGFYARNGFTMDGEERLSERHGEQFREVRFTRRL